MKSIKLTGITIIAFLFATSAMAQPGARQQNEGKTEQLTVPLSDPGKPYKLSVELVTGSIKVTPYDGKDVIIDVIASERRRPDRGANGMHRIAGGDNLDVSATEKNNEVRINSDMPSRGCMLNIRIPQGATHVKLSTVNDGNIVADNLNGQIEAQNVNGSIELKDISGSVVANTTNGRVIVTFKSTDPKAPMAFTSFNGNVDVTLPAGSKANIKAKSDRENIYSDFEFVAEPSQAKTNKTAKDGMYHLTVEDWVTGKIGGGGPEMLFKTFNGNIYIRKAK